VPPEPTEAAAWTRQESAAQLARFEAAAAGAISQREFERQSGVPRTTLQHWLSRKQGLDADAALVAFLESPEGVAFLHRLQVALFLVFDFVTSSGLRRLGTFLELAGLSPFMASSFGSCQRVSNEMETELHAFAKSQREQLKDQMAPARISLCEDETFHPETCLVAIEPVSDFIVLERYAEKRDAQTWDGAVQGALAGLPVTVLQSTSDEAKGLLAHAKEGLGAHHSPDLFHIQHELSRATSLGLAAQVKQAEEAVALATADLQEQQRAAKQWPLEPHGPGRPPNFELRLERATEAQAQALRTREEAQHRQELCREAIRGVGEAYHPVDLLTGTPQSAAQVEQELSARFQEVEAVAHVAGLSERCQQKIAKAKRLLGAMVCTVAFFSREVAARLDGLGLTNAARKLVERQLVPAAYLLLASGKASGAETRAALREQAEKLQRVGGLALGRLSLLPEQQARLERVVKECAELFQRSSSCVEGRNGQLSLRHHSLHRLSSERLEALTTMHNYFVRRPDGTTAAERFFGAKPDDLFAHLLDHLDFPARPAKKRSRKAAAPTLN
jgi:hypothetical protein